MVDLFIPQASKDNVAEEAISKVRFYKVPMPLVGNGFFWGRTDCLDEETEIYTFDKKLQKLKLKDLPEKFEVLSYNFKKKKQEIKSAIKIDSGNKDCYELELENGKKIISSGEHVFYNKDNREVKVRDLKEGDELLCFDSTNGSIGKNKNNGLYNLNRGWKLRSVPFNKDKTKRDFPQLSRLGNKNYVGWRLGLTKENDERVKLSAINMTGVPRPSIRGNNNPSKRLDVREKISIAVSGVGNGMYGKHHTKEWKKLMGDRGRGDKNIMRNPIIKKRHDEKMRSKEVRDKISVKLKGKLNPSYGKVHYPKLTFVKELNHKIRSSWEKEVCLILKDNGVKYTYEQEAFRVNEDETYTPDIRIIDNKFIEVKGPLYDNQIKKMKLFKEKNPTFTLIIITGKRNFSRLVFADMLIDYNLFIKKRSMDEILKN